MKLLQIMRHLYIEKCRRIPLDRAERRGRGSEVKRTYVTPPWKEVEEEWGGGGGKKRVTLKEREATGGRPLVSGEGGRGRPWVGETGGRRDNMASVWHWPVQSLTCSAPETLPCKQLSLLCYLHIGCPLTHTHAHTHPHTHRVCV